MKVKNKGITLIALVVTIIVMLLFTGIVLSMLNGNNSLLNRVGQATENNNLEAAKEIIRLAVNAVRIRTKGESFSKNEIRDFLEEEIENLSNEDAVVDIAGDMYRIEFRGYIFEVPDDFSDIVRIEPFDAAKWDSTGITPESAFVWGSENPNDGELYHTIIGYRDSLLSNTIVKIPSRCQVIDIQYTSENNNGRMISNASVNRQISRMFEEWFEGDREVAGTVEKVQIPETVTKLNGAFVGFSSIQEVELPYSLTEIGGASFYACNNLTKITIPNRVTKIGSYSFYGCANLKEISMPSSLKSVGEFVFAQTQWYEDLPDGEIYIGKVFYGYKGTMPETYTIKDGTKGIAGGAFAQLASYGTWYRRNNTLKQVNFPNTIEEIGDAAFYDCEALTNFTLPNSLKTIGEDAFIWCNSVGKVEFPASLKEIRPGAFNQCRNLATITFNANIDKIGGKAFDGTSWLSNQNPTDGLVYIRNVLYKYKSNGSTKIEVKSGTTAISEYAFSNQTQITEVELPDSLTSIGTETFAYCSNLETINLNDNIKEIQEYAFYGDDKLEIETLPKSLKIICRGAFYRCKSAFKDLKIPSGVTYIGEQAFYNTGIEKLTIPSSVNTIYQSAFGRCQNLETITINEGLQILTDEAFANCTSLEMVNLPGTISFYGLDIFKKCNNIAVIKVNKERENTKLEKALEDATPKDTLILYKGEDDSIYNITTEEQYINVPSQSYRNQKITVKSTRINKGIVSFDLNGEKIEGNQFIMPAQDVEISNVVFIDQMVFESAHDYENNMDETWEGSFDENTAIKIEFDDETQTESGYDRIWIYDSNGTFIRRYDGDSLKGKTVYLNDKGVKIRFTTDGSVIRYGFKCTITKTDEIAYRGLETSHPYKANCEYAFTAKAEGKEKLKVTFSEDTALNSGDTLNVFKTDETAVSSLQKWGNLNPVRLSLSNSDNVSGRSIVTKGNATSVVLSGNGSENEGDSYGIKFNIEEYTTPDNVLESEHDYDNNSSIYYDKVINGADILKLEFDDETYVENNQDYITIYSYQNGTRTQIARYTGSQLAGQTVIVRASGVSIQLTSNSANTFYGFNCTVKKGTIRYSDDEIVIESPHNYENSKTYNYTAEVPNADGLELRFDSQSILESGCDKLYINNANTATQLVYLTGTIGASTYTYDNVNKITFRMTTDGSVVNWGFKCTVVGFYVDYQ